jgi:hypothetical protein
LLADFGAFHKLAALAALNSESVILTQERRELEPRNTFQFWAFFPVDRGNAKTRHLAGLMGGQKGSTAARTINAAVVVVVVLAVMLLCVDAAALDFLRLMQAGALAAGHDAVGLGAVFHVIDMLLTAIQTVGFALGQAAGSDALIYTLLLIGLALINTRRIGLGKGQRRQNEGKYGKGLDGSHDFLLMARANSLNAIRKYSSAKISRANASLCKHLFQSQKGRDDR